MKLRKKLNTVQIQIKMPSSFFSTVSRNGDEKTFDDLVRLYGESTHMEEKNRIVRVLGYSSDENIVKKALQFCLSVNKSLDFL